MIFIYFLKYETSETHAHAFLTLIIFTIGTVLYSEPNTLFCTAWIIKFVPHILDYLLRYDTSWLADHGRKKSNIPTKRCHRIFILSHSDFFGFVVQFLCPLFVLSSNIVPIHLSLPQGKASKMEIKPKSKWQIKVRLLF